jgi:hypothetical protein
MTGNQLIKNAWYQFQLNGVTRIAQYTLHTLNYRVFVEGEETIKISESIVNNLDIAPYERSVE